MFTIPFPLLIEWYVWRNMGYTMGLYQVITVKEYSKLRAAIYGKIKIIPRSWDDYNV